MQETNFIWEYIAPLFCAFLVSLPLLYWAYEDHKNEKKYKDEDRNN